MDAEGISPPELPAQLDTRNPSAKPLQTARAEAAPSVPSGRRCCGKKLTPRQALGGAISLASTALGLGLASEAERDRRRAVCAACPQSRGECLAEWLTGWLADPAGKPLGCCQLCRCYLWAKTATADAVCPDGKWHLNPA